MHGSIDIDDSRFPLFYVVCKGLVTEEQQREYLSRSEKNLRRKQPTVVIMDLRQVGATPPKLRKMQAEWTRDHSEELRQYCVGVAMIMNSPLVRGMLTALMWLQNLPYPYCVVATLSEALDWSESQCVKHGTAIPDKDGLLLGR